MLSGILIKSRYQVKSVLGRGGMGVVYQAYDTLMRREVALKTLRDVPDGVFVDLFYRECSVLAGMVHPNVIEVFDMGEFEEEGVSKPYFVMPLLPGRTLHDLLYPAGFPLPVVRGVDIISQCCRGLQAAHDRGLLHRDIKPRNIFVMHDDAVKVIDFGVAHLIGSNSTGLRGTPQYMSPEQITFKPLTNRSDLFSLAAVAYEALTASHPFLRDPRGHDSDADIALAITGYTPPLASELNPSVSRAVSQAISKAMQKDPRARFESAAAFGEALQRALRNEGDTLPNVLGIRTRLERARRCFENSDIQFAAEIVAQLESEGHSDPEIVELRSQIDERIHRERIENLIGAANQCLESEEYTLALNKVQELLELEREHPAGLALKTRIETVLTEHKVEELLRAASEHLERSAFTNARQAVQDALKLRPNDTRARQFLGIVDSKQKESLRQRQEQERLFQSAQADWLEGRIEAAITALENLAEITRRSNDNRERVTEYKEFYRRVRKECDEINVSISKANQLLAEKDPAGAQQLCDRYLARYPKHAALQVLAENIAQYRQEEENRYRQDLVARLEREPSLDKRLQVLEGAVKIYPKNSYFQEQFQNFREKKRQVEVLTSEALLLQKQKKFGSAVERWNAVRDAYPEYPGLDERIREAATALAQQRAEAKSGFIAQINRVLEKENYVEADKLLQAADRDFPDDEDFAEIRSRRVLEANRSDEARRLLAEASSSTSHRKFEDAVEALSRAAEASQGLKGTAERVAAGSLKEAEKIVGQDWRAAQKIVEIILSLDPLRPVPSHLKEDIRRHEREEQIQSALEAIGREREQDRLVEAQNLARRGVDAYPGETRIQAVLRSIEAEIAERRRRQERQNHLSALTGLKRELESASSPADLGTVKEQAKSLAAPFSEDRDVQAAVRDIDDQISGYHQARNALLRNEIAACKSICAEQLRRNPSHQLFASLQEEAENREREQATEYLNATANRLAAEPDLDKQSEILIAAVQQYPNEPYFAEELALVKNRQAIFEAAAERARKLQRAGAISDALNEWRDLETIYPRYPGLANAIATCTRILEQQRAENKRESLSRVENALREHNYEEASNWLERAEREFPPDNEFVRLKQLLRERVEALKRAEGLLDEAREDFVRGGIPAGFQKVREAIAAGKDEPDIRAAGATLLLRHAKDALPVDLDLAESMISESASADTRQELPVDLKSALAQARRKRAFEKCAAAVDRLEPSGDVAPVLVAIREFLVRFPGDEEGEALQRRVLALEAERKQQAEHARKMAELRAIEEGAATATTREGLLSLLKRAKQLAEPNASAAEITVPTARIAAILAALAEITGLLNADRLEQAHDKAARAVEEFPDFARFSELLAELEFRRCEAAAEYLRNIEQRLAAEGAFARQAEILQEAIQRYPDETYYRDELKLVRNKQALLDTAVARARDLESRDLLDDALRQWKELGEMYPWFSSPPSEIDRLSKIWAQKRAQAKDLHVGRIRQALAKGDYDSAHNEIDAAWLDYPEDEALRELKTQLAKARKQQILANNAFLKGKQDLDAGRIVEGCDALREAFHLSVPESELREKVVQLLISAAGTLISEDWRQSELLLNQATTLQPAAEVPSGLLTTVQANRRDEEIRNLLEQVSRAKQAQDWNEAARLLASGNRFSDDPRVAEEKKDVEQALRQIQSERARTEVLQAIDAIRMRLGTSTKKRQIAKLRSAVQSNGWLESADEQIRSAALALSAEFEKKIAPAVTVPPKYELPAGKRPGISRLWISAAVVVVILGAGGMLLLSRRSRSVPIQLAIVPDHVSIAVGSYSCITPNCDLKLPFGHYQVHLAKEGYDPQSLSLDVDKGKKLVQLAATLALSPPALQISGDVSGANVSLDGFSLGTLREGQFNLQNVRPGQHSIEISQTGQSAKIAFDVSKNGEPSLTVPPSAQGLTIVAVAGGKNSGMLATSRHSAARVSLDGESVGTASDQILPLSGLRNGDRKLQVADDNETLGFDLKVTPTPSLHVFIAGSANVGTALVTTNVGGAQLLVDRKPYGTVGRDGKMRALLPVGTHDIQASKEGYLTSELVRLPVSRAAESHVALQLSAKPTLLEIRGAVPGTEFRVDHALVGVASNNKILKTTLTSGDHTIDISRAGFMPKQIQRRANPGEVVTLAGPDLNLVPARSSALAAETQDWNRVSSANSIADLQAFIQRYPAGPHASIATQKIIDLTWKGVQKNNPESIQHFLTSYPQGTHSEEARNLLTALEGQRKVEAEESDWNATDKNSSDALHAFLTKYSDGIHAQAAQQLIGGINNRKTTESNEAEETAWKSTKQSDRASVDNFLRRFPSGKYHTQAADALAALNTGGVAQSKPESAEIGAMLNSFAAAWSAKNIDSIVAIQPGLNKRVLRGQLADIRRLQMTITPVSPATVTGDRASVVCRRVSVQTFSDGTVRQSPSTVTFTLEKRLGGWIITGVQ